MARRTPIENRDEAYDAAVALVARKARTAAEVARELESRGAAPAVVESVVATLRSHRHLDDAAFADDEAFKLVQGKRLSPARAREELVSRGVPPSVAAAAVDGARDGARDETLCEKALAARLKGRALTAANAAKEGRALARLGYDEDVVTRTIERALDRVPPHDA